MTGSPIMPIGAPILSEGGEMIGCVAVILKIDFLIDKIVGNKLGKTGYSFMTDSNGRVIAHPKREAILELDLKTTKGMEAIGTEILGHKAGVESYVFEGVAKIAGFAPVPLTGWSVATTQSTAEFLASAHAIRNGILLVGGIFLALTILGVLFFARRISRPIALVVDGLNEGAEQVAAASGEVSASSQSLAEGASEQAASLEETSSSLEEMASMTKQNADNAKQANDLMKKITQVVEDSNTAMGQLTTSMGDISTASEETSKIIKTIDEIAFQTNLLALNAAVEAARAGEAGAGFAVVAEEVRNLAIRAAEAAKNTSSLIEGTIKKIKEGTEQVNKAGDAFQLVASSTAKMGELVGEVAAASNEQAQGIDQVNKAVAEMDKVVQRNAANAEESAAASEELNAQARQMKSYVQDLVSVVGGSSGKSDGRKFLPGSSRKRESQKPGDMSAAVQPQRALLPVVREGNGRAQAMVKPNKTAPEKVIPFEEDLSDF
jgi:methyl-accepting chemotaxis protein